MKPELITFDCAQTLVRVNWNPPVFAVECAGKAGLNLDPIVAGEKYGRLLQTRWRHYQQLNCTRDHQQCIGFWRELTSDWLKALDIDQQHLEAVLDIADRRMYDRNSDIFQPYPDTVPALQRLKSAGHRLAVISNWDYSLHRVLQVHELTGYFDLVLASLEEGIEKPEPEIFHIALRHFGVNPADALHVGDDPLDDVHGARSVGMKALLLDRNADAPGPGLIRSLDELEEAMNWTA